MDEDYFYSLVTPKRRPKDKKRKCLKCLKMRDSTPEQRICSQCINLQQAVGARAEWGFSHA